MDNEAFSKKQSPDLENALPQTLADPKILEIEKSKILKEKSNV